MNKDDETFTAPNGEVWTRPTAWAYFAACRAGYWHRHQLRQNGIEACIIPPDAGLYPPDETLQPIMKRHFAVDLRDVVLLFGHEHFGWPAPEDALGGELADAAEALGVKVAERLGYDTDDYWGVQGSETE